MQPSERELVDYLLSVMRGVLEDLEVSKSESLDPAVRFSSVFDSMAMVEFLGIVADDCRCEMSAIEECVQQRFGTVEGLARGMLAAGLAPTSYGAGDREESAESSGLFDTGTASKTARRLEAFEAERKGSTGQQILLAGAAARLPVRVQAGTELDEAVGRPVGWLERRAGILQRHVWGDEDPLEAARLAAAEALHAARVPRDKVGALLTVSEAPPQAVGLAAAIHHAVGLRSTAPCYELGGACTGFLSALSLAQILVPACGPVLMVAVETHSSLLPLQADPHGEAAALFGDGCAAIVLGDEPGRGPAVTLIDLEVWTDGGAADLICVKPGSNRGFCLEMEGVPLTEFALHALATATREITARHHISVSDLSGIVAHGGNGRMPAMLARLLHVPASKVWSEVATKGNLGSASVPVAWALRDRVAPGPLVWTAVGAGLAWGAALWEVSG